MKVYPISIVQQQIFNDLFKHTYVKEVETNKVKTEIEKFPLYDRQGNIQMYQFNNIDTEA